MEKQSWRIITWHHFCIKVSLCNIGHSLQYAHTRVLVASGWKMSCFYYGCLFGYISTLESFPSTESLFICFPSISCVLFHLQDRVASCSFGPTMADGLPLRFCSATGILCVPWFMSAGGALSLYTCGWSAYTRVTLLPSYLLAPIFTAFLCSIQFKVNTFRSWGFWT